MTAFDAWQLGEPSADESFADLILHVWPALSYPAQRLIPSWVTSLAINGGAATTADNDVTLAVAAALDGAPAGEMCFSDDGVTYSAWESCAASRAWQLPAQTDDDPHACTVYAKFRLTA